MLANHSSLTRCTKTDKCPALHGAKGGCVRVFLLLVPWFVARRLRRLTLAALVGAGHLAWAGPGASLPQLDLPRMPLSVGMHQIDAQVAHTPQQRQIGLMYRSSMPQHEGMLFIFEHAGVQCFWMKHTPLPLTAAFLADDGRIVNLADMQPHSEQSHCSVQPVRYVLEMNQSWFSKRGIRPGQHVSGAPFRSR